MNKKLRIKEKIGLQEHGFYGEVIFGKGRHVVPYIDPYGRRSYKTVFDEITYRDHNIVTIGGYQFAFDKLFNIGIDQETSLRVGDLNDESPQMKIGVARADYTHQYYNAECNIGGDVTVPVNGGINISANNFIFGFLIGDGGSREDNMTAIAPDYKNRRLYNAIPFRMSNDGYDFPEGTYYGRSTAFISSDDSITSYYIKKFDQPAPHIVHTWVSDSGKELETVDDTVFSSTSSNAIESYVEMNISISEADCRGYFTTTGSKARVNEFGLVSGWYDIQKDEYQSIHLFSHFTRSSIILEESDSLEIQYRLYAR